MQLEATDFTLPGDESDGGLTIALTRYRPTPATAPAAAQDRLSLIFVHGVSSHKESWKPTIAHIFSLQAAAPNNAFAIVEAWSMDAPNHGRAAIINEQRLQTRPPGLTAYQWGRAVQILLKSGLIAGNGVVGIGHSAGACVMVLSTTGYPASHLPYRSVILVDPPMMTKEILDRSMQRNSPLIGVIELAKNRKDIWPSRSAAREWLAKRMPWRRWSQEVLDLYVEHALRELPTATYPDRKEGVTLSCTREQESAGYIFHQDGIDSLERLKELCPAIPVHCIFGGKSDLVAEETQQAIVDENEGRRMATITRVAGAGHLVVQEDPKGLALAIWGTLHSNREPRSRL
ncbi:alpha/beta-hydrolase [Punctularia strigosozonata HHB-11173 SS5]|uniref:alpha/beta-hydrolase n=1 Tax=Punctularia strigosozonata (strain HHB-11173) TaxID=741275 RepID=UPI00044185D6|nr:alpha/beta-hydrolase [Punctularia strigosozonata HHB-11173 SS5]EIN09173.1 alpha/beta-hydrolase [Punctularia strigosozonata HHB-11173 SS5]